MPTLGNRLRSVVQSVERTGRTARVVLETPDEGSVTALLTAAAVDRLDLREGDEVEALVQVSELAVGGRHARTVTDAPTHVPTGRSVVPDGGQEPTES